MDDQNAEPEARSREEEAAVGSQVEEAEESLQEEAPAAEAEGEEPGPSVKSELEETGPCARLVKIEIPQELVHDEVEKSYEELRTTVFIKGFRKGRVPRHVLERRFGKQVLESVRQTLADEHFAKVVEEHSLRLALPATIDYEAIDAAVDRPLVFELAIEIVPEFTIDNYKGLSVERPPVEVTPEDVDRALEGFRLRRGQYRTIEEGLVEETDVPVCHAVAIHEGEEIWRQTELGANVASSTLGGMPIPGLKDQLLGAKAGDSRTFQVALPDDFAAEEHRGKQVQLEVTIDEIRRFEAPEATDEWAESVGFDDLEDLREELYDELRRHHEQEADDTVEARIAEQLQELTHFDVPEGLVDRMVQSTKDRQRMELLYRGVPREEIDKAVEDREKATRDTTVRQCKLYFIYEKIAEQEKIFVIEDDVHQRIQAIALNYRRRPEEVESELERTGRLSSLRQQMREEKVRDFLVQNANVTEAGAPPAQETPKPETGAPEPPPEAGPSPEGTEA